MLLDDCLKIGVTEFKYDVLGFFSLLVFRVEDVEHLDAIHTPLESVEHLVLPGNVLSRLRCPFDGHYLVMLPVFCFKDVAYMKSIRIC